MKQEGIHRVGVVSVAIAVLGLMLSVPAGLQAATRGRSLAQTVIQDSPERLAAGEDHTCQIKEDGTVRCWGMNVFGQLGDGTTTEPLTPVAVSGVSTAVGVTAGSFFTCTLIIDSTVRCWGDNGAGQLGDGTTSGRPTAGAVSGLFNTVALAAGAQHACALLADGTVRCWGANGSGQLGDGTTTPRPIPVVVNGLSNAVGLAAGASHTCAVLANGDVQCWGSNSSGQIGDGTTSTRLSPVLVSGIGTGVAITARNLHTCALLANGTVRCWGSNTSGQIGNGSTGTRVLFPVNVSNLTNAVSVTAGNLHTCAVLANNKAACWGANGSGELGDGTATRRLTPFTVSGLTSAVSIAAGADHSCAVVVDGSAACWGSNLFAQLGNGTTTNSLLQKPVSGGGGSVLARAIAAGFGHNCVVRASGAVSCWGENNRGQIGDGTLNNRLTPVTIIPATAVGVTAGDSHSCALLAGGGARCWGQGFYGQLGDGTNIDRLTPVTVSGLTNAVALSAGLSHTCALIADGHVRCWGDNETGQLGDGTKTRRLTPVLVSGITNAVAIAAGSFHTCALLPGGVVKCWGYNIAGQLGNGTTIDSLTPVTVSGLTSVVAIVGATPHTCALMADGSGRCWGSNTFGALGDGTTTQRTTPVIVSGLTNAVAIAGNPGSGTQDPSCALVSGGGARCWGRNDYGQVGDGTTTTHLTPTSPTVPTGSRLTPTFGPLLRTSRIATGNSHTCTVQANGAVFCWGNNESGQLGDGSTTNKLHPSVVPSFTLNINPAVALGEDVSEATVKVLAACDEGRELNVDVVLTQGSVSGHGSGTGTCVGALAAYPITVIASARAAFRGGPATVTAAGVILENGDVVDTQHWTRAVNLLGTDGTLEGSASGLATGKDDGSVRLSGSFAAEQSVSLDQATVKLTALLLEAGGAGELIRGAGGAALLPLTLTARSGSTPTEAIYQTGTGVHPQVRVEVVNRDPQAGVLEYSISVDRATMPVGPALCSGGDSATTLLRTRLTLHAGGVPADALDLTVPWRCLGSSLRTP